jgi:hypothetical protein
VEPLEVIDQEDGITDVKVHQLAKRLGGDVLSDSEVWHVYTIGNGLIERMDLKEGEKTQPHLQHSPDTRMCQDLPLLPERERHAFPSFRLAAAGLVIGCRLVRSHRLHPTVS